MLSSSCGAAGIRHPDLPKRCGVERYFGVLGHLPPHPASVPQSSHRPSAHRPTPPTPSLCFATGSTRAAGRGWFPFLWTEETRDGLIVGKLGQTAVGFLMGACSWVGPLSPMMCVMCMSEEKHGEARDTSNRPDTNKRAPSVETMNCSGKSM